VGCLGVQVQLQVRKGQRSSTSCGVVLGCKYKYKYVRFKYKLWGCLGVKVQLQVCKVQVQVVGLSWSASTTTGT